MEGLKHAVCRVPWRAVSEIIVTRELVWLALIAA
jgi:hypothetical protein